MKPVLDAIGRSSGAHDAGAARSDAEVAPQQRSLDAGVTGSLPEGGGSLPAGREALSAGERRAQAAARPAPAARPAHEGGSEVEQSLEPGE
jgi:hypothetical protein